MSPIEYGHHDSATKEQEIIDDDLVIGGQQLAFYQIKKDGGENGDSELQRVQQDFYCKYKKILEPRRAPVGPAPISEEPSEKLNSEDILLESFYDPRD